MSDTTPDKISPALLSIEQTCQLLNISRAEFYRLDSTGKFAPLSAGLCRKRLYIRDEIESWIQAGLPHRRQWQIQRKDFMHIDKDQKNIQHQIEDTQTGLLEAKPPEILQKLLWICQNWKKHWIILIIAGLIFLIFFSGIFVLPKVDLFGRKSANILSENLPSNRISNESLQSDR